MKTFAGFIGGLLTAGLSSLIVACAVRAEPPAESDPRPLADWVKKSNRNAKLMIELMAKLQPDLAAQFGVEGYDDQINDWDVGRSSLPWNREPIRAEPSLHLSRKEEHDVCAATLAAIG